MRNNQKINVFCLPFAGGSFYGYNGLQRYTDDCVRFVPIDLPGHGKRLGEPLLTNIHDIVADLLNQIKGFLGGSYAIYGHSMGAALAYLLAKKVIRERRGLNPVHLFLSGRKGPAMPTGTNLHLLPDGAFVKKLMGYGGMPREILEEKELMDLFLPILRADFQAIETYEDEGGAPLDIPLTVMIGLDDGATAHGELTWQEITTRPICVRRFPGGHFFVFEHFKEIAAIIHQTLDNAC